MPTIRSEERRCRQRLTLTLSINLTLNLALALRLPLHRNSNPNTTMQSSEAAALRAAAAALVDGLNAEQRLAVQRVLGGADYSLVLGMPGTGKTSLIVAAVRCRRHSGCQTLCLIRLIALTLRFIEHCCRS